MVKRAERYFVLITALFLATIIYLPVTSNAAASSTLRRLQLQQWASASNSASHVSLSRVDMQRIATDSLETSNSKAVRTRKLEAETVVTASQDLPDSINAVFQFRSNTNETAATDSDIPPEDDQLRQRNGSAVVEIMKDFVWTLPFLTDANATTEAFNPATVPHWLTFSVYIDPEQLLEGDYLQLFAGDSYLYGPLVMEWNSTFLQQQYNQAMINMSEAEDAAGVEDERTAATTILSLSSQSVLLNPSNWFQVTVLSSQASFRLHVANVSRNGIQASNTPFFIANWSMATSCPQDFQLNQGTQTCEMVSQLQHSAWLPLFVILPGLFVISLVICWLSPRRFRRKHCPKWCPIMFLSHSTFDDKKREILAKRKLASEGKSSLEFEELSESGIAAAADEMAKQQGMEDDYAPMDKKGYEKSLPHEREQSKSANDFLYGDGEGYEEPTQIHSITTEPSITHDDEHHSHRKEGDAAVAATTAAATMASAGGSRSPDDSEEHHTTTKARATEEREKRIEQEADNASPHATRHNSSTPTTAQARKDSSRNRKGWKIDDIILDELGGLFRKKGSTDAEHIIHQPGDETGEKVAENSSPPKNLSISVEKANAPKEGEEGDNQSPQSRSSSASNGKDDADTPGIVAAILDSSGDAEKSWIKRLKNEIKRTLFVWVFELIGTSVNIYFAIVYLNPSVKTPDRWSDQLSTAYLSFALLAFIGALINAWSRIHVIRELMVEMHTAFHSPLRHAQYNKTRVAPSIELAFMERRIHHLKIVGLTLLVESIPFAAMGFFKLYRFNSVQQNLSLLVSCGVSAFWVGSKITRLIAIPENRDKCKRLEEDAIGQLDWEQEEDIKKEHAQKEREDSQRKSKSQKESKSQSRSPPSQQKQKENEKNDNQEGDEPSEPVSEDHMNGTKVTP